ncbi:MAG: hypothetical protein K8R36_11900 [Planctomycetales bacterium]|nr:hypothetical protein [Planctomycetales bacterium]
MPVSEEAVAHFANLYLKATGATPRHFVCPITLKDDPEARLCNGHILCKKLKAASRLTIPQRADIDNVFGALIEGEFVNVANLANASPSERFKMAKELKITGPTGEKMPAFFAGLEAKQCFQQIELYDKEGKTVAAPFLRSHSIDNGMYRQMEVEWLITVHKYAFTAALVKSAYLTMFKIFGYDWVLDSAGDKVRRTLASCTCETERQKAFEHFSEFHGSCWITFNDSMEKTADSLGDGKLFFHYIEGDAKTGMLFAVSCLFWINGKLLAVTLPSFNRPGHYFVAWKYYQEFIRDRRLQHNIHLGRLDEGVLRIEQTPLSLKYTTKYRVRSANHRLFS